MRPNLEMVYTNVFFTCFSTFFYVFLYAEPR